MTDDSTKHPATTLAARIWDVLQQPNHSTTPEEIEQILRDGITELGLAQVGVDLAEAGSDHTVRFAWHPRPMSGRERRSTAYYQMKHRLGVGDPALLKTPLPAPVFPNPCSELYELMERERREIMKMFYVPAEMQKPRDIECQAGGFNFIEQKTPRVRDNDPYPPERRGKLQDVFDTAHVQTARLIYLGIHDGEICKRGGCTGKMRRRVRGCSCDVCRVNRPVVCSECGAQA